MLMVGGRPVAQGGNASFKGAVDLLRVSGRALATNEFLNATVERPATTTKTVAYWPFDANGAVADLTSRVDERMGFFIGQAAGEADQFGRRVHNPDATPDFIGDPSANAGSIRVTGVSGVTAHAAANWVLPEHSFTLEGWVKLAASPTKPFPQTLVTNDRDAGGYRASFTLDLVDAETLRLVARSRAGARHGAAREAERPRGGGRQRLPQLLRGAASARDRPRAARAEASAQRQPRRVQLAVFVSGTDARELHVPVPLRRLREHQRILCVRDGAEGADDPPRALRGGVCASTRATRAR